ncbi:hypothetical protein [uncultured Gammaproteobacteria bacterium]|nr:hypothetical protein [uncultured Gammaproteobacteria bacterium]
MFPSFKNRTTQTHNQKNSPHSNPTPTKTQAFFLNLRLLLISILVK